MALQISGMGSGLDTASIIQALMQVEQQPQAQLQAQRTAVLAGQTAWQSIVSKLTALQTAADALSTPTKVSSTAATSSNTSLLTATTSAGAPVGSLTMWVNQLATAQQLASGSFASASTVVGAGTFNMSTGSIAGISNVGIADSATKHTLTVTQASSGAVLTGATAASLTYGNGTSQRNETFTVNGVTKTITLTNSSYASASALVSDLQTQLNTAFGSGTVTVAANSSGVLSFTTGKEGSAATVSVSGTPTSGLGFTTTTSATGQDAQGTVDGTAVTIAPGTGSNPVTLIGAITLTPGAHIGVGTVNVAAVRTTSSTATLQDLANAINAAGGPASASIVAATTGGSVQLILGATQTGTANAVSVSTSGLTGFTGTNAGFTTLQAAQDAQISLGGGMTVTRSSNTITDLMGGVTLNLVKADPTTAVTVSVASDPTAMSTKVKALVDAMNALRSEIGNDTAYNTTTNKGAALTGDSSATGLVDSLRSIVSNTFGTGATQLLSQLGISADKDGVYQFDSSKLSQAVASDPNGVNSLVSSLATKISTFAKNANDVQGTATLAVSNAGDAARRLQDQIDGWDIRLQQIQDRYQAQFTALDVAMQQMRSQSNWLAGQLAGLPTSG